MKELRSYRLLWALQQEINNPSPVDYDYFGYSVALCADTLLLLSAILDDTGATDTGSVYVYTQDSEISLNQEKLVTQTQNFI